MRGPKVEGVVVRAGKRRRRHPAVRVLRVLLLAAALFYGGVLLALLYLRFLPPLITGVQLERQVEAWTSGADYERRYRFLPRERISDHLARAVVAAEDVRFYSHHGFDWEEIRNAREQAKKRGEAPRGASTITQQLVKNLFFTTGRSWIRKGLEVTITPLAELVLGKDRILELYLNVVEWGPGVFGADAAAHHHYDTGADRLTREQASRLAAILPAPLRRDPDRMGEYARIIQRRMRQMGW